MGIDNQSSEDFSLSFGGPVHRATVKMRLQENQGKLLVVVLCFAWLPLLIITAIEGTLYSGTHLPFLKDVAMQARILVALPMLVIIKAFIDIKVIDVSKYLVDELMSPEDRQVFIKTILRTAKKWMSSALTDILLLMIVIGTTVNRVRGGVYREFETGTSSWMASANQGYEGLSVAGSWAVFVSIPIFQLILLRLLWRYFVWMMLLFRISKLRLILLPTHADRCGGLGILMMAQIRFNMIFVAGGAVISGQFITRLLSHPDSFNTIRNEVIGYVVVCIMCIFIPMLFFTRKLSKMRNDGLLDQSKLAATLSRRFEEEWENNLPLEKRIEQKLVDPSMVFDYSGIFDLVQQIRLVPITLRDIITMTAILIVPFIPILFIHFSVPELLQRIVTLLT
jgi:hypothetical protein